MAAIIAKSCTLLGVVLFLCAIGYGVVMFTMQTGFAVFGALVPLSASVMLFVVAFIAALFARA